MFQQVFKTDFIALEGVNLGTHSFALLILPNLMKTIKNKS